MVRKENQNPKKQNRVGIQGAPREESSLLFTLPHQAFFINMFRLKYPLMHKSLIGRDAGIEDKERQEQKNLYCFY